MKLENLIIPIFAIVIGLVLLRKSNVTENPEDLETTVTTTIPEPENNYKYGLGYIPLPRKVL